jgi:hypothetical protein
VKQREKIILNFAAWSYADGDENIINKFYWNWTKRENRDELPCETFGLHLWRCNLFLFQRIYSFSNWFPKRMGPDIAINEGLAQEIRGKSGNYIARIFSLVDTPKKL